MFVNKIILLYFSRKTKIHLIAKTRQIKKHIEKKATEKTTRIMGKSEVAGFFVFLYILTMV